jgi:hypothetical protein
MDLPVHVPPMIFPAVSLLYLSYNARFLTLAQLIRALHKEWKEGGDPAVLEQIVSLRARLRLIVWMQVTGALSFVAAAVSTTCLFFSQTTLGHVMFGASLVFLIVSVVVLLAEVVVSTRALSMLLDKSERGASPE